MIALTRQAWNLGFWSYASVLQLYPRPTQHLVAQTLHHLCRATAVVLNWCRVFYLTFEALESRYTPESVLNKPLSHPFLAFFFGGGGGVGQAIIHIPLSTHLQQRKNNAACQTPLKRATRQKNMYLEHWIFCYTPRYSKIHPCYIKLGPRKPLSQKARQIFSESIKAKEPSVWSPGASCSAALHGITRSTHATPSWAPENQTDLFGWERATQTMCRPAGQKRRVRIQSAENWGGGKSWGDQDESATQALVWGGGCRTSSWPCLHHKPHRATGGVAAKVSRFALHCDTKTQRCDRIQATQVQASDT